MERPTPPDKRKESHMTRAKKKVGQKTTKPGKDIVASMAEDFREKLLKLVEKGIKDMAIDLTGVEMVDCVGLGILIAAHNSLNNAGGRLTITNVSQDIYRFFKTMRVDQNFEVKLVE